MKTYKCPICDSEIELADDTRPGERLTCPNCYTQLALRKHRGKLILTCPTCKEEVFDPQNCEECDRRMDKKKLLDEGRL
jgi:hypothetical protein